MPNLAKSLGAHAAILCGTGRIAGATDAFREGIAVLKSPFLRLPEAFQPLMTALVRGYRCGCVATGAEVDSALLDDIAPLLSDAGEAPKEEGGVYS